MTDENPGKADRGVEPANLESVKLTILVDNQAADGLAVEHGFSAWIEVAGRRILFDTGQGTALVHNAAFLGVDLRTTDLAVLSHGHYDHTGGLALAVQRAPDLELHCHPAVVLPRYSIRNRSAKAIGMPESARMAAECLPGGRMHWVLDPVEIAPGVGVTGFIPRVTEYEDAGGPFFLDRHGKRRDTIDDDLALWLRTRRGLVVVLGCGHAGLINTLTHARQVAATTRIHAVIGGFHLVEASEERLRRTLHALEALDPGMIVPCHCTGDEAVERLKQALGRRVLCGRAGLTLGAGGKLPGEC